MISVIIALYNAENVIGRCLESVLRSSFKDYEVIVVDDCSTDNSYEVAGRFPCRLFNLPVNSGPARARNFGVEQSKGDILFFIDSDTELEKEAMGLINETFKQENDLAAIVGLPEKRSLGHGMASAYNALKNHYTLATAGRYCDYFTTQVGAVRRKTFLDIGGFDSSFRGADVEDIEFGLRLPKGRTIIHKDVLVGHHFPGFSSIARKYFRRSILLARVVKRNKKMAGAHASLLRSLLVLTALISFMSLSAALYNPGLFIIPAVLFALFLTGNAGLFSFISREKGIAFMLISIFYEYVFSVIIGLGGITGMLFHRDSICHPELVSGSQTMPGQEIPKPVRDDSFKV
ncbi:MAG: hypothetical protein A2V50_05325 [Bacteroidetes bacterium RBG_19FT_COMBO_42_10]|nr:MAG: hypothetical protein A2V50_05325 [Bacteroidetes bacterium RBG_19FT_COMBO_42_10]